MASLAACARTVLLSVVPQDSTSSEEDDQEMIFALVRMAEQP